MEISKQFDNTIGNYDIRINGKFTFADNANFRVILDHFEEEKVRQITIFTGNLEFVDSAALGMLLIARDKAIKYNKKLILIGVNGQVKKMFELAHFDRLFNIE
ncbi:MAG: STAS domain-containing protein [Pseudomonadota bacterium]